MVGFRGFFLSWCIFNEISQRLRLDFRQLYYLPWIFLNFRINCCINLHEQNHPADVENHRLKKEEIGVAGKSIEPGYPHEDGVESTKSHYKSYQNQAFCMFEYRSHVAQKQKSQKVQVW